MHEKITEDDRGRKGETKKENSRKERKRIGKMDRLRVNKEEKQ